MSPAVGPVGRGSFQSSDLAAFGAEIEAKKPQPLGEKERHHLMRLCADLARAWSHPAASAATRKRILRTALKEIIARVNDGFIGMVLHWQGGDHTALRQDEHGRQASLDGSRGPADARA